MPPASFYSRLEKKYRASRANRQLKKLIKNMEGYLGEEQTLQRVSKIIEDAGDDNALKIKLVGRVTQEVLSRLTFNEEIRAYLINTSFAITQPGGKDEKDIFEKIARQALGRKKGDYQETFDKILGLMSGDDNKMKVFADMVFCGLGQGKDMSRYLTSAVWGTDAVRAYFIEAGIENIQAVADKDSSLAQKSLAAMLDFAGWNEPMQTGIFEKAFQVIASIQSDYDTVKIMENLRHSARTSPALTEKVAQTGVKMLEEKGQNWYFNHENAQKLIKTTGAAVNEIVRTSAKPEDKALEKAFIDQALIVARKAAEYSRETVRKSETIALIFEGLLNDSEIARHETSVKAIAEAARDLFPVLAGGENPEAGYSIVRSAWGALKTVLYRAGKDAANEPLVEDLVIKSLDFLPTVIGKEFPETTMHWGSKTKAPDYMQMTGDFARHLLFSTEYISDLNQKVFAKNLDLMALLVKKSPAAALSLGHDLLVMAGENPQENKVYKEMAISPLPAFALKGESHQTVAFNAGAGNELYLTDGKSSGTVSRFSSDIWGRYPVKGFYNLQEQAHYKAVLAGVSELPKLMTQASSLLDIFNAKAAQEKQATSPATIKTFAFPYKPSA